ncbi:ATP-binding cassette domain-containing protein [Herpetosiphon geysericola]|uniref:ABC transporter domain-containing protein n=1 Tax=Herpetosiphon geysericola TaxID=70996 RepID=A0A0P6XRI7_9CHLR|nr:ATP-binding cassette domain-containing protein [Herpetosiphon geysericola]KPL81915.1 hypothetical protein SE18_20145 [Herpetosiphon geysericola]
MAEGKIFGLLGANGSSKSSLIRLITTLLIADSGQIPVLALLCATTRKQSNAYWFSIEATIFKHLSALETLMDAVFMPLTGRPVADEDFIDKDSNSMEQNHDHTTEQSIEGA